MSGTQYPPQGPQPPYPPQQHPPQHPQGAPPPQFQQPAGAAPPAPQQHSPQAAHTQAQQPPAAAPAPPPRDKAADDKARAELKERYTAASIGAQVILDFNEDGSIGARGGAAGTVEENSAVRDAYLVSLGFDPWAPSGPPPSKEMLDARRKREEEQAKQAADGGPLLPPKATRVSSLAADLGVEAAAPAKQ